MKLPEYSNDDHFSRNSYQNFETTEQIDLLEKNNGHDAEQISEAVGSISSAKISLSVALLTSAIFIALVYVGVGFNQLQTSPFQRGSQLDSYSSGGPKGCAHLHR